MEIAWTFLDPPLIAPRSLLVVAGDRGVVAVSFVGRGDRRAQLASVRAGIALRSGAEGPSGRRSPGRDRARGSTARRHLARAVDALRAYFRGEREPLDAACDLPAARDLRTARELAGRGPSFDARVWRALGSIPPGELRTYGELAAAVGRPGAARAVGGAVGRNPIPILLPCHRVVGARGQLTGFGPGLGLKVRLLEHEGFVIGPARDAARRRVTGKVPRKVPRKITRKVTRKVTRKLTGPAKAAPNAPNSPETSRRSARWYR